MQGTTVVSSKSLQKNTDMRYKKTEISQEDLFRNRLSNQLDPRHEMMKLSELIPWKELEKEFGGHVTR